MNNQHRHIENNHLTGLEVAVVGMAGRFPGSRNLDELWKNLRDGKETVKFFTDKELEETGIDPREYKHPNYVKARGYLEDIEYFDANFFGYSATEAQNMDPQTRVFLECAWHALEDAGYVPYSYDGIVGVYGGSRANLSWTLKARYAPSDGTLDRLTVGLLSAKDHLCTRTSYVLNLRGPSYTFYTACSTSLVAVHLACQAVLSGECDMALAGGTTINLPQERGYIYDEEMISSPDGHTRSFDANARGLVDASGVGIVVVKPLEDALRDNDNIYAVVKGSGVNNDGNRKIGYTAPSISGQEALMKEVYGTSEVDTESITFVECHGSATPLGDPVEIEALRRAFHKTKGNICAVGSIKSNFGHADCAAGIASFIKTVLAVKNRQIPPTLNFESPNPKIDFENSPFYVNTETVEWRNDKYPLRAGVNSLGLGGTNAHIIVQEFTPDMMAEQKVDPPRRDYKILPLSAKTETALDTMTANLARYIEENPGADIADVAYTLKVGRDQLVHRRAFVCSDAEDALTLLKEPENASIQPFHDAGKDRPLVFMYSGQGSEYVNMGRDLYEKEEEFRKDIDDCFEYLTSLIGKDLKYILYPNDDSQMEEAREKIHTFYYTQPVKFIYEYAYSRLLMRWGLKPHALIGYSFGEYIVACLAGVFTMEDALKVLMKRGDIMEKAPAGLMLSVSLSEKELKPFMEDGLYIGGVNTESLCLVSGNADKVEALQKELEAKNIDSILYRAACGGHSPLMEPILPELGRELVKIKFNKPEIPYVSGLTGTWIKNEEALDPYYFTRQLRQPVRFADALKTLLETPDTIFLEVGPGTGLVNFVKTYIDDEDGQHRDALSLTMVRHHKDPVGDDKFLLNRVAQLWTYGKKIDWDSFYRGERRKRVSIPKYPFEGQRYWLDFDPIAAVRQGLKFGSRGKRPDVKDWFYVPSWKTSVCTPPAPGKEELEKTWLVFMDAEDLGEALLEELRSCGRPLVVVRPAKEYQKLDDNQYRIDYGESAQYHSLFKELKATGKIPATIIHQGNLSRIQNLEGQTWRQWEQMNRNIQDTGFYSLLYIAQAIGRQGIESDIQLEVVTNGMLSTVGENLECPEKITVLGPVKNIPQEYPNIKCRVVDVTIQEGSPIEKLLARKLSDEFLTAQTREQIVAYRGKQQQRLVQTFEPAPLEFSSEAAPAFKQKGVYLLPGGLGGVGLTIADALAKGMNARLVLTSRKGLPPGEQWESILQEAKDDDKIAGQIRKVMELEKNGGEVLVLAADIAKYDEMKAAVEKAEEQFGPIDGIINCAFLPDGTIIDQRTRENCEPVFAPKIRGTRLLHHLFENRKPLDFFAMCSSLAAVFGPVGQVAYTAANAYVDAFAHYRAGITPPTTHNVSINWGGWAEVGYLLESVKQFAEKIDIDVEAQTKNAMLPQEGVDAFNRIMSTSEPQVLVSTQQLEFLMEHLNTARTSTGFQEALAEKGVKKDIKLRKRPRMKTEYVEPRNSAEEGIAEIWRNLFGLETVGVKDDFFELGGDSLKAMTVSSKIKKELNVKIPVSVFFSSPTIEELAGHIGTSDEEKKDARDVIPVAPQRDYYPAAPVQEPLYIYQQKEPDKAVLNVPTAYRVPGVPGQVKELLESVFKKLIERNEIYRTSFHIIDGQIKQKIHRTEDVEFRIDYHETTEEAMQDKIAELTLPFDLSKAPLLRADLINCGGEKNVLLMDTHQIILDGTSAGIFRNEFMALFTGTELPAPPLQYKDYSQWINDRLEAGDFDESKEYWMQQYNELSLPLKLPMDKPEPENRTYEARPMWFNIDRDYIKQLRDLAHETGTTMFMIWLAAVKVLLYKYSKQQDIVLGTRIAGRTHTELEAMLGKYSNTVIIRSKPQLDQTFKQFLEQVKEISLGAFKHQDYPSEQLYEQVYREQGTNPGQPNGKPLYNTVFVYNNMKHAGSAAAPGKNAAAVSGYPVTKLKSVFDLLFQASEVGEYINVLIQASVERFKPETIESMRHHFMTILETILEEPNIQLSEIINK
jgi:acyl transferase domain-containing protein/acyl carrier protein